MRRAKGAGAGGAPLDRAERGHPAGLPPRRRCGYAAPTVAAATPPPEARRRAPAPAPRRRHRTRARAGAQGEPPGFFADLFSNTPELGDRRSGARVLAGSRRDRRAPAQGDEVRGQHHLGTDIKTNTVSVDRRRRRQTGENSLASDFSREGLGNIDTDEVDPIAEAEVYLAYGRDAQAEEILKDALKKDPQRQEIYLKLLEIHSQHNKPQASRRSPRSLFA